MAPLSTVTLIFWKVSSEMHEAIRRGGYAADTARLDAEEFEMLSLSHDPTGRSRDVTGRLRETCRRSARFAIATGLATGLEAPASRASIVVPLRAAGARP